MSLRVLYLALCCFQHIYMLSLIICKHKILIAMTLVYVKDHISGIMACLSDIKCWMSQNFRLLNDTKSEVILFSPPNLTVHIIKNIRKLNNNIRHLDNIKAFILSPCAPQQWQFPAAFWQQKYQRLLFVSSFQNTCSQEKQMSQRKLVSNCNPPVIHLSTWDVYLI